jgi:hypothetical protein
MAGAGGAKEIGFNRYGSISYHYSVNFGAKSHFIGAYQRFLQERHDEFLCPVT